MAWFPISNVVPQYWKQAADGTNEYSGAVLKAYQVGTITNIPFATDNTGGTTANSIALNANGNPEVSGNVVIPHLDQDYKLALYPDQTSADADSGATWTIDNLDLMGFDSGLLNPEHATDTGTDTYESATNTSAPDSGTEVVRDFRSANTTTTPSLDSLTITTRDGNPLWANALSGPHTLQLASDSGSWLVLDPRPTAENVNNAPVARDSSGRAKFADPSASQDAATKVYTDAGDPTPQTVVDATNGGANDLTEIDFTGLKAGAKRIVVLLDEVSSTSDALILQLGDSGGIESSGYTASAGRYSNDNSNSVISSTSGFIANTSSGDNQTVAFVLEQISGNKWVCHYTGRRSDTIVLSGGGVKELSGELDRVRLTTTGTGTFDNGNVNVVVE